MAYFKIYQGLNKDYYWHLKSDKNGEKVCWAEGYKTLEGAKKSIEWVKLNAPKAPIK